MLNYSEAIQILAQAASKSERKLGTEKVRLIDSINRIAAEKITSSENVPSFSNSAMDGFALRSELTRGASASSPKRFKVIGTIAAGDAPLGNSSEEVAAWEIMTGAPFPEGVDACIRIEDVKVTRDSRGMATEIEIREAVEKDENRREPGEDFEIGQTVIEAGVKLQAEHLLALSSLGVSEIQVLRKPRVALISTGSELVTLDQKPELGQIRNSSAYYLQPALQSLGAEVNYHGIVRDDPEVFRVLLEKILQHEHPDLVITTGAVSMGKYDFVGTVLDSLGAKQFFHKVAIRPGKPLIFAEFGRYPGAPVAIGLPGNPVSSVVGLRFFIEPYLRTLQGIPQEQPIRARVVERSKKPDGLRCFYKARVEFADGEPRVKVLPGQLSFMVSPLLKANAWAVLPEAGSKLDAETWVDCYPMSSTGSMTNALPSDDEVSHSQGGCC